MGVGLHNLRLFSGSDSGVSPRRLLRGDARWPRSSSTVVAAAVERVYLRGVTTSSSVSSIVRFRGIFEKDQGVVGGEIYVR